MSIEPTGPWVEPMKRAKATDPRNGLPSWNRLGELAGLSTSTVTGMVAGTRKTSADTIQKVAAVLRERPETISEWLELGRTVRDRYEPPAEADMLTERQRKALTSLIRAIVAPELEEGNDRGTSAQKMTGEMGVSDDSDDPLMPPKTRGRAGSRKGGAGSSR